MQFNRAKHGAKCEECPFRSHKRVWGEGPALGKEPWSGITLVGEAPGADEERTGRPFIGAAGRQLDKNLRNAGISRLSTWVTNTIACRPPGNNISSDEALDAWECCEPGFHAELDFLSECGGKVFVPLGGYPLARMGVSQGISKARGYVYERGGRVLVPSYHPSYLMRGQFEEIPTAIGDLRKAARIAKEGWKPLNPKFLTHPTLAQAVARLTKALEGKTLLAVDIETTSLVPEKGRIIVIGFAESATQAFSIPLLKQGGAPYWTTREEATLLPLVRKVLKYNPTLFHNANFDMSYLKQKGFPVGNLSHDTIILGHEIHPELKHSLAYTASIYATIEYWKNTLEDKESSTISLQDEELRKYNLWDCVALHAVLKPMMADAKALGVYDHYLRKSLPLVAPIMEMTETGMPYSKEAERKWNRKLTLRVKWLDRRIRRRLGLPEGFNFGSTDHLGYLLYGVVPNSVRKALEEREVRTRELTPEKLAKAKGTKKWAEMEEKCSIFERVVPLTKMKPKTTDKGAISTDEDTLLGLKLALNNRLLEVEHQKKPSREEVARLRGGLRFLDDFSVLREMSKLLSTYGSFNTWEDGRVHFPFNITGTATGRLSSGDKKKLGVGNAQNIPPSVRKLFIAEPGFTFVGADYSSLEPRVLAYISGDDVAIEDFAKGIKVYHAVMRDVGIGKDHPEFDLLYKCFKIYVLCTNYGGSVQTAYKQMLTKVEKLPFTLGELKKMHDLRMKARVKYAEWVEETKHTVLTTRVLTNFGGRRRLFMGPPANIVREALDYGPQSGAAEVMNRATVAVHRELHKKGLRTRLVLQIHDALYLYGPEEEKVTAARILKKNMEAPVDIPPYKGVVFPAEVEWGPCWGSLTHTPPEVFKV